MSQILQSQQNEIDRISDSTDDAGNQLLVSTATYALARYEKDLGIPVNDSDAPDVRRKRILSKLQGIGTITLAEIQRIISMYIDGVVTVTENFSSYTVDIKFISHKGVPDNIDAIKNAIAEIIPAHIKVNYIYTYRTWDNVKTIVGTWNDVKEYTWDGLKTTDILTNLYIDESNKVYYRPFNDGNAILIYEEGKPYARLLE